MHTPHKNLSSLTFALIIISLASLACSITTQTPAESSPTEQPDLIVSLVYAGMSVSGTCLEEYGPITTEICVQNFGDAPAGPFVLDVSDGTNWVLAGLGASETDCFSSDLDLSGATVTADANNDVAESNEVNNTLTIPVPTPPVLCTPVTEVAQPPTATSEPARAPEPDVSYRGVSFSFDAYLAAYIAPETVPAEGDAAVEPWTTPEYYQFTLNDYPLPGTFHDPRIMVFPVGDYKAINSVAGGTIDQLQQLLVNKPANPENIPFLPVFNAGQFMRAQVKYIDFQNGSGVRFLTQYGQAAWPINNQDMFYTFQGLTSDGQYYISAVLPVSHPSLPHPDTVTMDDAFYDNFMNYVADVEGQLNTQPEGSFAPALTLLDAMIQSLNAISDN